MDYKSILAIAEENKKSSRKSDRGQYLTTKLSAPKKEKKDSKTRSHVIQKLIEEKDKEKKKKEEKERQRQIEEEKKNRFVIPKRSDSPLASTTKQKMVADVTVTPDHFVNKTITDLRKNEGTRAERTKTKITVEARLSLEEKRLKIIEKLKNPEPEKHKDKDQDTEDRNKIQSDSNESNHSEAKKRRIDSASKDGHRKKERHKSKSTSLSDEAHSKHKSESEKSRLDNEKLKQMQQDKEVLKKQPSEVLKKQPKPKRPPPPDAGLSFADLLKIAEVKSKEPITMEMLLKKPKEEKKARPLTQKEKEHLLREKESFDRKNDIKPLPKKETQISQTEKVIGNNKVKEETVKKDNIISNSSENTKKSSIVTSGNGQNLVAPSFKDKQGIRISEKILKQNLEAKDKNGIKISEKVLEQQLKTNAKNGIRTSEKVLEQKVQARKEDIIKQEQSLKRNHQGQKVVDIMTGKGDRQTFSGSSKNSMNRGIATPNAKGDTAQKTNMNTKTIQRIDSKQAPRLPSKDSSYDEEHENILVCRPTSSEKQQVNKKEKEKQQENKKEKDNSKPKLKPGQEPTNPWDRIYGQIKANNPKSGKKRFVIESDDEDEYDDLDGFIDDGDDGNGNDYSKYIKEIFGYDRNRFKDEDEDDIDNMESNFAQVEKEEKISARIGLQEDLEDMKKEEEELRLKMLAKKKLKKK
ncbi:hypothetical protein ACJMK2_019777 [Sinanodonta woodiana]|uniref:Protein SPT2 homolog n=1 Tax=Sinanodonta woodiana TaxID=1069815 RepID=A0ABD3TZG0_SINWO